MKFRAGLVLSTCMYAAISHQLDVTAAEPASQATGGANPPDQSARRALESILQELGPLQEHFIDVTAEDVKSRIREDENFARLIQEGREGKWSAALVTEDPSDRWSIEQRFDSMADMKAFLRERNAVVEVWLYGESGPEGHRLTAHEVAKWSTEDEAPPSYMTATFIDRDGRTPTRRRLEYGIGAADETLSSALAYQRHRDLQHELRRILRSRDADGNLSARAQLEALDRAQRIGTIDIKRMPAPSDDDRDLLLAFECRTALNGQITEVLRAFRASEIKPRMIDGLAGTIIEPAGETGPLSAVLYSPPTRLQQSEDTLPVAQGTELRIRDPEISDPRRWTRLEFGEPSLLRRQSLANFGLVNGHMEGARKHLALKKSKIDRIAEPLFAGLNIGGGISGASVPLGESARLGYNALLGHRYVPHVPSPDELRDLYSVYLAKSRDPELAGRVPAKLTRAEMRRLESAAKKIPDQEVADALRSIDDRDLKAMLQLPRRQNLDQKYRLLADILTDLAKVTGETESGVARDIFDNQWISLSGEVSLSTLLAMAIGDETVTPLSGVSLEDLANGDGPARAWLQYFNVSLDLRAIANTIYLLRKRDEADRELQKPFAHAPRMSDLASYEVRLFGYPLLLRYKRGLLEDDIEAFENNYAYGILGTKVIARFPTQADFYRALRAGTMAPIGLVKISDQGGFLRKRRVESNLPVFGYRIPDGEHAGKTAIIIYGIGGHRVYSEQMDREALRFDQFERILRSGGSMEQLVAAEDAEDLPPAAFEPQLFVGADTVADNFSKLLSDLNEYDRHVKFAKWNLARTPDEELDARKIADALRARGVDVDPASSPLVEVDDTFGSFTYRKRVGGKWQLIRAVHFPSSQDIRKDIERRSEAAKAAHEKYGAGLVD